MLRSERAHCERSHRIARGFADEGKIPHANPNVPKHFPISPSSLLEQVLPGGQTAGRRSPRTIVNLASKASARGRPAGHPALLMKTNRGVPAGDGGRLPPRQRFRKEGRPQHLYTSFDALKLRAAQPA
ncbi:hypothetical protein MRX96_058097 [Rhipicephalus microplus]